MNLETHPLQPYLDRGLAAGLHRAGSMFPEKCCLLEAATLARGKPKSDDPADAGLPDWRSLNDAGWSTEAVRAVHMGELALAYWDWVEWTTDRKLAVVDRAVVLTVQRVISALPGLTDEVRERCRAAETLSEANDAAIAADFGSSLSNEAARHAAIAARRVLSGYFNSAVEEITYAAFYADRAAFAAVTTDAYNDNQSTHSSLRAANAAADAVLITACGCWLSALEASS